MSFGFASALALTIVGGALLIASALTGGTPASWFIGILAFGTGSWKHHKLVKEHVRRMYESM